MILRAAADAAEQRFPQCRGTPGSIRYAPRLRFSQHWLWQ